MEGDVTSMTITEATTSIFSMASEVMDVITGNPLLFTLFCGSFVFLGCGIVKAIKKTAKR